MKIVTIRTLLFFFFSPDSPSGRRARAIDPINSLLNYLDVFLGTGQYLWEYRTGKFVTRSPVNLVPQSYRTTTYIKGLVYGAPGYFNVGFKQRQRLFWRIHTRGHGSLSVFMLQSHSQHMGPWRIFDTGPKVISNWDLNGAIENWWLTGYGKIHYSKS